MSNATPPNPYDSPTQPGAAEGQHPPRASLVRRVLLILKVVEVRLRFIAILAAVGLFLFYWGTVKNYWDKWTRPGAAAVRELDPGKEFYCPMHPQVTRTTFEPNGAVPNCPICGMPLSVRVKGEKVELPPGITARVQFSPERIQLAGIRTVPIEPRPLVRQITTVGNVTYDESRLSRIVSRVDGYVEKLFVDKTFALVQQGQPLAELYSPELYSASQELLLAARRGNGDDLAAIARQRLQLLGVSPEEIDAVVRSGAAIPRLLIRSPQSGVVIAKPIVAGTRVEPGMTLLEVADLSVVWIEAEVYEKDIPFLRPGQEATASVESVPQRTFRAKVAQIYPRLESATRTVRVRFEVDNPRLDGPNRPPHELWPGTEAEADARRAGRPPHELWPGMYATVSMQVPLGETGEFRLAAAGSSQAGEVLAVPEPAVIDTGSKQIVYVERRPGLFEGVEVQLGPRVGEYYPVLGGLKAGDRVAAAGAFLVDAETRLNPAAAATYFGASGGPQTAGTRGVVPAATQQAEKPAAAETHAPPPVELSAEELKNIAQLPAEDQPLAKAQKVCPITGLALGSMGPPHKIILKGRPVFLCCKGCVDSAFNDPDAVFRKLGSGGHRHD